jgi:hypothetical protein
MKKFALLTLFATSFIFTSCLKEKTIPLGDCDTVISYSTDIRPIIESSCKTGIGPLTGCHDAWIDNYSSILSQVNSGDWANEVFVEYTMPVMPNEWGIDSLTAEEIKIMKCWIDQGYPDN